MNQWHFPFLGCLFLITFFSGVSFAEEMIEDKVTGVTFPTDLSFAYEGDDYNLEATGVATRKKLFIKIYSAAHYIQDPEELKKEDLYNEIINSNKAKQLTSKWVRGVDKARFAKGYLKSFEKATSKEQFAQLRPTLDQFLTFFGDVRKNDSQVVRSLPGGTLIVEINGVEKGRIQNEQFAKALWGIWFGPHSVLSRERLVSQLH